MGDVSVSKRYDVSGAQMWRRIGDPRDLYRWHPMIEATEMTDDASSRINTRTDGGRVSETILEHGDRHYSYRIDQGPLPLDSFVATIGVRDEKASACVVRWDASFRADGSEAEAAQLVRAFLQAGLDAL